MSSSSQTLDELAGCAELNIRRKARRAMLALADGILARRFLRRIRRYARTRIMLKIITKDAPFYCPMCKGRILSRDSINTIPTVRRLAGATFYCPSCEMFVAPATESAINTDSHPDVPC